MINEYLDEVRPLYKNGGIIAKVLHGLLSNNGGEVGFGGGDYTGSYYYGVKPDTTGVIVKDVRPYGGKNAATERNPLKVYLGLDTIGLHKIRHDKYPIGNKQIDVDVFDGKILPIKRDSSAYVLQSKLKEEFDRHIKNGTSFNINTNDYPIDTITYNKQILDNTRNVKVTPIKKGSNYSMKLTKYWDLSGSGPLGTVTDWINSKGGGKPFVLEQIIPVTFDNNYSKENYHFNKAKERAGRKYGGLISTRPTLATGGSIYIKPSHRGRLTELKARTGKSEAELYSDGNPAHKKMVVFARNARKWHH